jgi:hypothetical protein
LTPHWGSLVRTVNFEKELAQDCVLEVKDVPSVPKNGVIKIIEECNPFIRSGGGKVIKRKLNFLYQPHNWHSMSSISSTLQQTIIKVGCQLILFHISSLATSNMKDVKK